MQPSISYWLVPLARELGSNRPNFFTFSFIENENAGKSNH